MGDSQGLNENVLSQKLSDSVQRYFIHLLPAIYCQLEFSAFAQDRL